MKVGFIGLGNVGFKLANSLLASGFQLIVHDIDKEKAEELVDQGAQWAATPKELAEKTDCSITCLPSPAAIREVLESPEGLLHGMSQDKLWIEMSTTDQEETLRLAEAMMAKGALALEAPVSGGCHRAATGNIAILAGGTREAFEIGLPALQAIGHKILHVGPMGQASVLKVVTNFLASTHLVALGEALMLCKKSGIDLRTAFEGIKISSGNSFVHETESQVILNGSYNINFTMDLVCKDVGLFKSFCDRQNLPTDIAHILVDVFQDGREKYGDRAWSSMIVKRLEDACNTDLRAPSFPEELLDDTPRRQGYEVGAPEPIETLQ